MDFTRLKGSSDQLQLWAYGFLVVVSMLGALASGWYFLALTPALFILGYLVLHDFTKVYFLLLASLPLSMEVYLPGGLGTDFPSEPLMIGMMLVTFLYVLKKGPHLDAAFLRHPLTLLLLIHLTWIFIATLFSENLLVSVKFLLAKIWYVVTFYFLAYKILNQEKRVQQFIWAVCIPLFFTILVILIRHSAFDFAFKDINKVVYPFYRNHVNYACLMALMFPAIWLSIALYRRWSWQQLILISGVFLTLVGIYFSYTRAAYVAIFMALATYGVVKLKWMRIALALALLVVVSLVGFLATNNKYLEFAPDYNKTITHNQFDNLLEATYKGEDISTMERVYRWIAGFYMSSEKRWTGFGPGNFFNYYKSYTVSSFRTYVSDNPEKSGIHSYYLMTLAEQGYPGFLIFLFLAFFVLIKGEMVYHQTRDLGQRRIVLLAIVSTVVIDALLIINDMVETDKVGPFFFIFIALIVRQDIRNNRALAQSAIQSRDSTIQNQAS